MSQIPDELVPIFEKFRTGNMDAVLKEAEAALAANPKSLPVLGIAGLAALRANDSQRAEGYLKTHLALDPSDNAVRGNLANALSQMGKHDEALDIVKGSNEAPLVRMEGFLYQEMGNFDASAAAYNRAVTIDPIDFQSWNNLGNIEAARGNSDEAITAFEHAITYSPDASEIYINLSDVLAKAGKHAARLKTMHDAFESDPRNPKVLTELGIALGANDDSLGAIEKLRSAVNIYALQNNHELQEAHIELCVALESLNRVDELDQLVVHCDAINIQSDELAFLKTLLARRTGDFKAASQYALQIPDNVSPVRVAKLRGDIADRLGDTEQAFFQYTNMNNLSVKMVSDSPNRISFRQMVEKETAFFSNDVLSKISAAAVISNPNNEGPIFLVGFPRSGTTLLDTMMMGSRHLHVMEERPVLNTVLKGISVEQLAKLDKDEINAIRKEYFRVAEELAPGSAGKRLVDKNPLLMTRIPAIFRLFPKAQIILAERHPYDVVFSCFMANFQLNHAMRSFVSLEEAAKTYDSAFKSWENSVSVLPIDMHKVRYERLVIDPKKELNPMISWLGLDWQDSILETTETARNRGQIKTASYAQVIEPLYKRASGRWELYEKHIAEIKPILEPWVKKLGY